ncbi:MAG: sorbosone dehydrogenase family protein, partial [Sediminibacterium sp.]
MQKISLFNILSAFLLLCFSCAEPAKKEGQVIVEKIVTPDSQALELPEPYATKSVKNFSEVIGWADGQTPVAPGDFTVTKFAEDLVNPRWIYVAPNGDVFVAEANKQSKGVSKAKNVLSGKSKSENEQASGNTVLLFRDKDNDGKYETRSVYVNGINMPFGMLVMGNFFYVAGTDGLWKYPYNPAETMITGKGKKIVELPAGGYNNHWTRNIIGNKDGSKIFITVGSGSNVAEHGIGDEFRRANILEIDPDGKGEKVYASGLRNPVGMD